MKPWRLTLKYLLPLLFALILMTGCNRNERAGDDGGKHDAESIQLTAYSSKSEVFMEFPEPVAGQQTVFLIHLTRLADWKPVTDGPLKLIFTPLSGAPVVFEMPAPIRPGIYQTELTIAAAGTYSLAIMPEGKGFADTITIPGIDVIQKGEPHKTHADEKRADVAAVIKGTGGGTIPFLKEQQWPIDFMSVPAEPKDLVSSFTVMGELMPAANAEGTVSAPLAGVISGGQPLPFIGKKVTQGEIVAFIEPPIRQEGGVGQLTASYAETRNRVALAQKEYERAKRLYEAEIAPLKRVEEAKFSLSSARAALEPLERALKSVQGDAADGRIAVRSIVSGTVVEVNTANGRGIEAGQPIVRIVNTDTLWLKANVPATGIGAVDRSSDAMFTVAGLSGQFKPSRLVSVGDMLDPQTRTLPVLFEVPNQSGQLKVGLFANVAIRTGSVTGGLAVPRDALVEDENRWFVFVQSSGETFGRREVKVGIEDGGFVQITGGLATDERVVTRGAYYIKQSESAAKGGADQGHAH